MVFDGRAVFDIDSASVLESLGSMKESDAIKEFRREYKDTDSALFSFDLIDDQFLSNPLLVEVSS